MNEQSISDRTRALEFVDNIIAATGGDPVTAADFMNTIFRTPEIKEDLAHVLKGNGDFNRRFASFYKFIMIGIFERIEPKRSQTFEQWFTANNFSLT